MAGLDTSIALGIKPVDFGDPNEGRMNALRAQMMQMQMQQGQFNMMKAQRDMEYQNQQRAAAAALGLFGWDCHRLLTPCD